MRLFAALAASAAMSAMATPAHTAHRGALWAVVRGCLLDSRVTGSPWPCLSVDHQDGVVVLPDPKRPTQVLVTPTIHVSGIESRQLLNPSAPNYWRAAWSARTWVSRRARRTIRDNNVGLAVNSMFGRTQDELHIHLDCLRPSVRRVIDHHLAAVVESWAELPLPLVRGHRYRARWLPLDALITTNPFQLLAADPEALSDRSAWTLVMLAAQRPSGERGFVLLSHKADPGIRDLAAGEELLDHRCSALQVSALP